MGDHSQRIDRDLFLSKAKIKIRRSWAIAFSLSKVKCCSHLPDFLSGAHHENPHQEDESFPKIPGVVFVRCGIPLGPGAPVQCCFFATDGLVLVWGGHFDFDFTPINIIAA